MHANAVAQDSATGERTGRIDGNDAYRPPPATQLPGQGGGEGAFASPRRARNTDDVSAPCPRIKKAQGVTPSLSIVLDEGEKAGERTSIAGQESFDEIIATGQRPCRRSGGRTR